MMRAAAIVLAFGVLYLGLHVAVWLRDVAGEVYP